ncbi:hypothetical protein [Ensifer soli]|uniref:hypothetical protein n=1 Tax=Ciceribacter sp. sgz301302 TaxID=3342379 RepID=UPI0035BAC030
MNPHTQTFVASGAIGHRRLVKFTSNDGEVALATAATDLVIGVTDFPNGAVSGGRVDVVMFGPTEVDVGGTITPGAYFVADANGKAVAAAPATGVNNNVGGRLSVNGADGDIARCFVNPVRIQG